MPGPLAARHIPFEKAGNLHQALWVLCRSMRGKTAVGVGLLHAANHVDEAVLCPASRILMAVWQSEDRNEGHCQLPLRAGTLLEAIALELKVHCLKLL